MLKIENLYYSFSGKELYENISFTLETGQHCAFIGTNGSGKSTFIDMILNSDKYIFDGKLELQEGSRIGYVSQFSELEKNQEITVFEYIAEKFNRLQEKIDSLCEEMGTSENLEELMEEYQNVLDEFNALGGDNYDSIINKKLNLANLIKLKDQPMSVLSGGEFKLIQVIRELLTAPDFVIMDEPDVFLDFENLVALKELINAHKGTIMVVTHNRYLLNFCFNKILHLENKDIQEFDGNYVEYNFTLLEKKIEQQELAVADTLEIQRNEGIVEHLTSISMVHTEAARGRALKARKKILERLHNRRIKSPFIDVKQPKIVFGECHVKEDANILKVNNYSVVFDEVLLDNVSFEIKSNEKVALIGSNGTGKTTLLRDIYLNSKDSIVLDPEAKVALLSQIQGEMLNEENTMMDEFFDIGFKTYDQIREYLKEYNFEGEVLDQKISTLSGGEKNILQLAKIATGDANLLLLDEPTSHLDTYSQIALEKAIAEYKGSVIMISHDFYTIANSVDYVLIIDDKNIRKMSTRKFRKMVYANHFKVDYLEFEQKKKELETRIEMSLSREDFEAAKVIAEELGEVIESYV